MKLFSTVAAAVASVSLSVVAAPAAAAVFISYTNTVDPSFDEVVLSTAQVGTTVSGVLADAGYVFDFTSSNVLEAKNGDQGFVVWGAPPSSGGNDTFSNIALNFQSLTSFTKVQGNLSFRGANRLATPAYGTIVANLVDGTTVVLATNHQFANSNPFQIYADGSTRIRSVGFSIYGANNAERGAIKIDGVSVAGAIPEPGAWALMIVGFGGAGVMIRRRRGAFA